MNEKLVIVPKIITTGKKVRTMALFVVSCALLLLATFIAPGVFFVPALIVVALWIWQAFFSNIEYEYTYFDGDLKFAKISNKSRRKKIADINMEDVLVIAPKGDRSVYKYENDSSIKCKDLTSGSGSGRIYELITKKDEKLMRYEIEPDEEMLEAIRVKYARLVTK